MNDYLLLYSWFFRLNILEGKQLSSYLNSQLKIAGILDTRLKRRKELERIRKYGKWILLLKQARGEPCTSVLNTLIVMMYLLEINNNKKYVNSDGKNFFVWYKEVQFTPRRIRALCAQEHTVVFNIYLTIWPSHQKLILLENA